MAWWYVFFAGVVEVVWVLGLRYSTNVWEWLGTVIMIIVSFYLIIKACATLPSGTVYAVFTGMGATAIAIIDFTFGGGQFSLANALLIALIITGVVGIKLTTTEQEEPEASAKQEQEQEIRKQAQPEEGR